MLAAIDLGIRSPRFLRTPTLLLQHVRGVKPAFKMTAAEFPLLVLLITRTLGKFLDLYFVIRELRWSVHRSGQWSLPSRHSPELRHPILPEPILALHSRNGAVPAFRACLNTQAGASTRTISAGSGRSL